MKLTNEFIESLDWHDFDSTLIFDEDTAGFGISCKAPGRVEFVIQVTSAAGNPELIPLGSFPEISVDVARWKAVQILGQASAVTGSTRVQDEGNLGLALSHDSKLGMSPESFDHMIDRRVAMKRIVAFAATASVSTWMAGCGRDKSTNSTYNSGYNSAYTSGYSSCSGYSSLYSSGGYYSGGYSSNYGSGYYSQYCSGRGSIYYYSYYCSTRYSSYGSNYSSGGYLSGAYSSNYCSSGGYEYGK